MAIQQISVFVQNQKGALNNVLKIIAEQNIEIRALSIADTSDFGILRFITEDSEKATLALSENHFVSSITEVVGAKVSDRPGGLSEVVDLLAENNIDVEYLYAFVTHSGKQACVVFRVNDNELAEKVLKSAGIPLIEKEDIASL